MKHYCKILSFNILVILLSLFSVCALAQSGADMPLKFNKTSHNFGKFSINAGKQ